MRTDSIAEAEYQWGPALPPKSLPFLLSHVFNFDQSNDLELSEDELVSWAVLAMEQNQGRGDGTLLFKWNKES